VLLLLSAMLVVELTISCRYEYEDFTFAFQHMVTVFINMGLFASVWVTVMLAVERYIAICHPMQVSNPKVKSTFLTWILNTTLFPMIPAGQGIKFDLI
jgi:hypothetical protein